MDYFNIHKVADSNALRAYEAALARSIEPLAVVENKRMRVDQAWNLGSIHGGKQTNMSRTNGSHVEGRRMRIAETLDHIRRGHTTIPMLMAVTGHCETVIRNYTNSLIRSGDIKKHKRAPSPTGPGKRWEVWFEPK